MNFSNKHLSPGVVLGVSVISWCMIAMYIAPALGVHQIAIEKAAGSVGLSASQIAIPVTDVLLAIHTLFAGFVVANIVFYMSIVICYRRLADG